VEREAAELARVEAPEPEAGRAPEPELEPEALEAHEPVESTERLEPIEPVEPFEPFEPLEPFEPFEPTEPAASPEAKGLLDPLVLEQLQTRHAELLTRINQRIADPVQRDVLRGEAERLNPETWVTPEEARTGLEHFEQWFEAIRAQLPQPTRRGRRRRRRRG
jgi:hypothetical protein